MNPNGNDALLFQQMQLVTKLEGQLNLYMMVYGPMEAAAKKLAGHSDSNTSQQGSGASSTAVQYSQSPGYSGYKPYSRGGYRGRFRGRGRGRGGRGRGGSGQAPTGRDNGQNSNQQKKVRTKKDSSSNSGFSSHAVDCEDEAESSSHQNAGNYVRLQKDNDQYNQQLRDENNSMQLQLNRQAEEIIELRAANRSSLERVAKGKADKNKTKAGGSKSADLE